MTIEEIIEFVTLQEFPIKQTESALYKAKRAQFKKGARAFAKFVNQ
jgi:hypothetical protein